MVANNSQKGVAGLLVVVLLSAVATAVLAGRLLFGMGDRYTTSGGEKISRNERYVTLEGETISQADLEWISSLKHLTYLKLINCNLSECRLPELTFVSKDLYLVSLEGSKGLWDTSFLAKLPASELDLTDCADITSLDNLNWEALDDLSVDGTGVTDLTPLTQSHLGRISFARTAVSDLSPLAKIDRLWEVDGSYSQVTSLDDLADKSGLYTLRFDGCAIPALSKPFASAYLHCMSLAETGVSDLSGLANCSELREINLAGNPDLTSLDWVNSHTWTTLSELNVAQTGLKAADLAPLAPCAQLENLTVDGIELGNLDLCRDMEKLTDLSAVGCGLTSVRGISQLQNLEHVLLGYNHIKNVADIPMTKTDWPQMELDLSHNEIESLAELPGGRYRLLLLHGNAEDVGTTIPADVEAYEVSIPWFEGIEKSPLANYDYYEYIYLLNCPTSEIVALGKAFPTYRLSRVNEDELLELLSQNALSYSTQSDFSWYVSYARQTQAAVESQEPQEE